MSDDQIPEFDDVLRLLWEQAQDGSVTATAALARELRARARSSRSPACNDFDDELSRLLDDE